MQPYAAISLKRLPYFLLPADFGSSSVALRGGERQGEEDDSDESNQVIVG